VDKSQDHGGYLSFLILILKNQICVFILITFWVSQLFKQVVGKNDYNRRMKEFNKHFVSRIKSIPSAFTCLLLCSTNLLCCISWSNSNLNESNEWAMELGVEVWQLSGGGWGRLGFAALHTASRHGCAWRLWKVQNWTIMYILAFTTVWICFGSVLSKVISASSNRRCGNIVVLLTKLGSINIKLTNDWEHNCSKE
jgi:hypothetical protein